VIFNRYLPHVEDVEWLNINIVMYNQESYRIALWYCEAAEK